MPRNILIQKIQPSLLPLNIRLGPPQPLCCHSYMGRGYIAVLITPTGTGHSYTWMRVASLHQKWAVPRDSNGVLAPPPTLHILVAILYPAPHHSFGEVQNWLLLLREKWAPSSWVGVQIPDPQKATWQLLFQPLVVRKAGPLGQLLSNNCPPGATHSVHSGITVTIKVSEPRRTIIVSLG